MGKIEPSMMKSLLAVALAAGLVVAGCGGSGGIAEPVRTTDAAAGDEPERSTTSTTTAVDDRASRHATDLARGESEGIASQLVNVPGYAYVDPPASEVEAALTGIDEKEQLGAPEMRALALHGVVADDEAQNVTMNASEAREVGFLELFEFWSSPPAGLEEEIVAAMVGEPTDSFDVAGTHVMVTENPGSRDSRYFLAWIRHGVMGVIDGAEREPLERWVRAYLALPEHEPRESDLLAAELVGVPGYAYANYWEPLNRDFADAVFGERVPASSHVVADEREPMTVMLLGELPDVSIDALAARLDEVLGVRSTRATVGKMPVIRVQGGDFGGSDVGELYAWVHGDVAGIALAGERAPTKAFLADYFAALGEAG